MSYQVKRIDPYWKTHPLVPVLVVAGALVAAAGYHAQNNLIAVVGGVLLALSVLVATKPVVSAVLGTLGLLGGLATFVVLPNPQLAGMAFPLKLVSTLLFAVLYMVLMDVLVLSIAVLYNLFGTGMGGISLDIEEAAEEA